MLEFRHLQKKFGEKIAVSDLNLTLNEGKVLGLLGRNGAGKTTTIKMLLDLLTPTGGEILWKDKPFRSSGVSFGYLPEERGLFSSATVYDQLVYFGKLEGLQGKEIDRRIDMWLEKLEIPEHKKKKAKDLSKGNQQKIQLIVTMLHDPEVLILDEPFSGLDPVNANMFNEIITESIAKGKTIVMSSHQMNQVESFCHDICIMKDGLVKVQGSLEQVKSEYGYRNLVLENNAQNKDVLQKQNVTFEEKMKSLYVRVTSSTEAMQILQVFEKQNIVLREFKMVEPTLHEIFVERVR